MAPAATAGCSSSSESISSGVVEPGQPQHLLVVSEAVVGPPFVERDHSGDSQSRHPVRVVAVGGAGEDLFSECIRAAQLAPRGQPLGNGAAGDRELRVTYC